MYMLFEYIFDYENPELSLVTVNENIEPILEFLSKKEIKCTSFFDDQQHYLCDDGKYILINGKLNEFKKIDILM